MMFSGYTLAAQAFGLSWKLLIGYGGATLDHFE